ncbi:hypothetical protein IW261DRAFT_1071389 [Armillaria novae-zelandiae]|uniref:Mid2 domain-containing protein n=1 Tax=Armillaria novae-zelandiae TaxID=153914 RepID=A0AA39PD40_9AGAR|nr:hypothetical protein IW261DRAFT_1071389 [Armillaria novae-zelandiae]
MPFTLNASSIVLSLLPPRHSFSPYSPLQVCVALRVPFQMPWRRRIPITSGDSSTKSSQSKLQLDGLRFQASFPSHQRGLSESHQRLRRGFQEQNSKHKSDGQVNCKKGVAADDGPQHHILRSSHQRNDNDDDDSDDDSDDDGSNDDECHKKPSRGGSSKHGTGQSIESGNGGEPNNNGNGGDNSNNPNPTSDYSSNDGGSATGGGSVASSTNGSSCSVGIAETTPGPATAESTSQSLQPSSVLSQSSVVSQSSSVTSHCFSSQSSITSDIVPSTTSGSLVAATSAEAITTSSSPSSSSLSSSQTIRVVISSPPSTSAVPSTASASSTLLSTVTSPSIALTSFAPTSTAVPVSPSNPSSPSSDLSRTSFVPIIGGIVGAVVAISAVLLGILFYLRRRRKKYCAKVDSGFAPYKSFKDEKLSTNENGDPPPQIPPPPMMRVFHRVSSLLMRTYPSERRTESRAQTPIHNPFAETTSFASSRVSWLSYVSSHTPLPGSSGTIEETMRSNPFDDPVDPSAYPQTLSSPLERVSSLLPGTTISERRRSTPLVSPPPPENRLSMTASAELSPQEDPDRFSSWTDRKTMSRHSAMKDSPLQKLSMELYPVDVGSSNDAGTYLTGLSR